jgi:hypothetical protein
LFRKNRFYIASFASIFAAQLWYAACAGVFRSAFVLVLAYQRYRKFQASCSAPDAVMPEGYPKS